MGGEMKVLGKKGMNRAEEVRNAWYIVAEVHSGLDVLSRMIEQCYSPRTTGSISAGNIVEGSRSIIASLASHAKRADDILANLQEAM